MAKAYATRVGAGPVPERADDETGEQIRERGGEFGTTTGRAAPHGLDRPRRPALRRAHQLADRRWHHQARRALRLRPHPGLHALPRARTTPSSTRSPTTSPSCTTRPREYEELPGWSEDISECRSDRRPARRPPASTCDCIAEQHRRAGRRSWASGRAASRCCRGPTACRDARRRPDRAPAGRAGLAPRRAPASTRPLAAAQHAQRERERREHGQRARSVICTLTMPSSVQ